jgi:hypothetical protein
VRKGTPGLPGQECEDMTAERLLTLPPGFQCYVAKGGLRLRFPLNVQRLILLHAVPLLKHRILVCEKKFISAELIVFFHSALFSLQHIIFLVAAKRFSFCTMFIFCETIWNLAVLSEPKTITNYKEKF